MAFRSSFDMPTLRCKSDASSTRNGPWKKNLAGPTGLEPATSGVTGRRSSRLNYDPATFPLGRDVRSD